MSHQIAVLLSPKLYNEFILRSGKHIDVASWIENVVQDFLDRTKGDENIWSKEHAESVRANYDEEFEATYGEPEGYYQWDNLRLWNGTRVRMKYKGESHEAAVVDEELLFDGIAYSPSQLARAIADGTSRNAWRDLWIKEVGTNEWVLADELRIREKSRIATKLSAF